MINPNFRKNTQRIAFAMKNVKNKKPLQLSGGRSFSSEANLIPAPPPPVLPDCFLRSLQVKKIKNEIGQCPFSVLLKPAENS